VSTVVALRYLPVFVVQAVPLALHGEPVRPHRECLGLLSADDGGPCSPCTPSEPWSTHSRRRSARVGRASRRIDGPRSSSGRTMPPCEGGYATLRRRQTARSWGEL
jgi:hypothetical protein